MEQSRAGPIAKGTFKELSLRQNDFLWFIYPDADTHTMTMAGFMLSITIVDALR